MFTKYGIMNENNTHLFGWGEWNKTIQNQIYNLVSFDFSLKATRYLIDT